MQVNKRTLSDILGISERSLTEWQKAGLPIEIEGGRGSENLYDTAAVVKWMVRREVTKAVAETPRNRLDSIRADREELALARDLDEVAPAALYEEAWKNHIMAARTELLALPETVASSLAALYDVDVDPTLIQQPIEAALSKLESFDVDIDPDESEYPSEDEGDCPEDD
ncbi:terminase small subunit [Chromobacterium violaceum]|uniref:terminase small subunit n=1 Tax=Chromobacterium violaceum TaxID=536 RepID=UPI001B333905|nr:terminase small subunit [Chromobacterium violaceum]MBP4049009.1 terminase small subunit [Chromobacterium violaceum]